MDSTHPLHRRGIVASDDPFQGARQAWHDAWLIDGDDATTNSNNDNDDDDALPLLVAGGFESAWARFDALGGHVRAPAMTLWRAPPLYAGGQLLFEPRVPSRL
ncbi:hypothetical protein pdul_cds_697 [Pandoravirus dulcis]|uniref:Uncharacterized protein n=1 Tax=Pandoravirus dulcis TaxID=1349409 RepID=S4VRE3_9VIRU|nr:hypothetical protein pdul_cds_697 [Pandoravirus dulcis]AGO82852.1 hypothetical protein pdul_cds_697 [Pandoravirus dulcis]